MKYLLTGVLKALAFKIPQDIESIFFFLSESPNAERKQNSLCVGI